MSDPAKDLITKLLVKNPDGRISLTDALEHEWFKTEVPTEMTVNHEEVIKRMLEFQNESLLVQKMKTTMANLMGKKHVDSSDLNGKFKALDTEHNGMLNSSDLIRVLVENGIAEDDELIISIKENYNADDKCSYSDFLAANMDKKVMEKEWLLFNTFSFFDRENTGFLNASGIQQAFKTLGIVVKDDEIVTMIKDSLGESKETISFDDFKKMMRGKEE